MSTNDATTLSTNSELAALVPDRATVPSSNYFWWKGLVDRSLALLLLLPGLPIMGVLVVLIRLTSKGPGVFRQVRVGRDGKPFVMYKLRSMKADAETKTGPVWTKPSDQRITFLGKLLRKTHLDELPQLFNVLRGEMSLIGPRPERPEFVVVLAEQIHNYGQRLTVLPGITGLAQINLPPDTDLDSVRRKQILDLEYIRTAGPWMDLRMFLCTLLRLVGLSGERAMRLMGLHRDVHLPSLRSGEKDSLGALTPQQLLDQARERRAAGQGTAKGAAAESPKGPEIEPTLVSDAPEELNSEPVPLDEQPAGQFALARHADPSLGNGAHSHRDEPHVARKPK